MSALPTDARAAVVTCARASEPEAHQRLAEPPGANAAGADRTSTLVVLTKRPVPGHVKTRLQTAFTAEQAAALAAASLDDTLAAVRAAGVRRRVVALDEELGPTGNGEDPWLTALADRGFDVVEQGSGGLDDRLAASFEAVLDPDAPGHVSGPALLVGMDTPQLNPGLLEVDWSGVDAVLGPALDGGYWAIGFRENIPDALLGVPMSTDHTFSDQLARLTSLGLRVRQLPWLRDVDTPPDAAAAAAMAPSGRFARVHHAITRRRSAVAGPRDLAPVRALEAAFSGAQVYSVHGGLRRLVPAAAWTGGLDAVDEAMLAACTPPVLDVGCGPGRLVTELNRRGVSALGVDASAAAVAATTQRGGCAVHRRVQDRLPGEGGWGSVLLADGNIGIDGDPYALLERVADLLATDGRVVVEVSPGQDDLDVRDAAVLELADGRCSRPMAWARLGAGALEALAARLGLRCVQRLATGGREVVVLAKDGEASDARADGAA